MTGYRLEVEFDHEPAYIFGPEQSEDDEPLITIAPGNPELARVILAWLDAAPRAPEGWRVVTT